MSLSVCLSFDFDALSVWVANTDNPATISRGEFGAVAIPRILALLERHGEIAFFATINTGSTVRGGARARRDEDILQALAADVSSLDTLDAIYVADQGTDLVESRDGFDQVVKDLGEKLHYINPVPINEIAERWIGKYERHRLKALGELKRALEGSDLVDRASSMSPISTARRKKCGRR